MCIIPWRSTSFLAEWRNKNVRASLSQRDIFLAVLRKTKICRHTIGSIQKFVSPRKQMWQEGEELYMELTSCCHAELSALAGTSHQTYPRQSRDWLKGQRASEGALKTKTCQKLWYKKNTKTDFFTGTFWRYLNWDVLEPDISNTYIHSACPEVSRPWSLGGATV